MRELTKSLFSFSWAMSLFGVQQMVNLTNPDKAAQAFDAVADAAAEGFEGITKATLQTGDHLQGQLVDAALGMFSRDALDPARLMRTTSDVLRQSTETLSQGFQEATAKMQSFVQEQADADAPGAATPGQSPGGAQGGGSMGGASGYTTPQPSPSQHQPPPPPRTAQSQGWGPMPDPGGGR
jgi:hypothetical protein